MKQTTERLHFRSGGRRTWTRGARSAWRAHTGTWTEAREGESSGAEHEAAQDLIELLM